MKKTYMKPTTAIVGVDAEELMSVSFSADGSTGTASISNDVVSGEVLSKDNGFDLWADDEE